MERERGKGEDERRRGYGREIPRGDGRPLGHGALVQVLELSRNVEPVRLLFSVADSVSGAREGSVPARIRPDRPSGPRSGESLLWERDAFLPARAGQGKANDAMVFKFCFVDFPDKKPK